MSISGMGFTGSISVDLQNNLQVNCMHVGFNWVFSSFCRTHSSGDHGDQEPWAFDVEVIDITRVC
jgi:alpha-glucosidase